MQAEKDKRDYGTSDPSRLRALASCGKLPAEGVAPGIHEPRTSRKTPQRPPTKRRPATETSR
ncbi:MAG TPA: hypothetical protein VGO76_02325 [Luteibacter sp.]|jgi:hypothetical protein|nr:hypothetical protein [Luteibacter sp.]